MAPRDPRLSGRIGGLTYWSHTVDRTAATAPGRAAFMGKWEREVRADPAFADATEAQVMAAADARKRAHFSRLALASARARSKRR